MDEYLRRLYKGKFEVQDFAPSTIEDLNRCKVGLMKVWSGASENTVWGSPSSNYLFRAWHDSLHLKHGVDFSIEGELRAASIQCADTARTVGDNLADVVNAETRGQIEYYAKFNEFPVNQLAFIASYLQHGKVTGRY